MNTRDEDASQRAITKNLFSALKLEVVRESVDMHGARKLADLCREWGLNDAAQEVVWVVSYDAVRSVRTVIEVARGGWDSVEVSIPTVLSAVLMSGADRFMLVHNHPPGDVTPTEDDKRLTDHIGIAAEIMGLFFEDHVIVAPGNKMLSMVKHGLMRPSNYRSSPKAAIKSPSVMVTYLLKGDGHA